MFERQANCGAAELLFQRDEFTTRARQYATNMASVLELAQVVGSSVHATLRRFVESHDATVAGVVLDPSPHEHEPLGYRRYEVVRSQEWMRRFGSEHWLPILRPQPYGFIGSAPQARITGAPVRSEFVFPDVNSDMVRLRADVYSNHYRLLALIWIPRSEALKRHRIIMPTVGTSRWRVTRPTAPGGSS